MATATKRLGRTAKRVKGVWAELGYAQRRLFEIRTGVIATRPQERVRPATTVDELEALYELEHDQLTV